jgi:hypothetical protein
MPENEGIDKKEEQILEWLKAHPELLDKIGKLKAVAQSGKAQMNRIDQAEGEVIQQVDALGRGILAQWAAEKSRQASQEAQAEEKTRRHGKKNS